MQPKAVRLKALEANQNMLGGYEIYAVTDDGGVLCAECLKKEHEAIDTSYPGDGWHVTAFQSNDMLDQSTTCDHCSKEVSPYV